MARAPLDERLFVLIHSQLEFLAMFREPLVLEAGETVTRDPFVWRDLARLRL